MPPKNSRRLVIDASVARSSGGEDATYPTSKTLPGFFACDSQRRSSSGDDAKACKHEWDRHQSGFARRWRQFQWWPGENYVGSDVTPNDKLREKVERTADDRKPSQSDVKGYALD